MRQPGPVSGPRTPERLSPLDAAFYALESPQAPMHLGWAAVFRPPAHGPRPGFDAIGAHIARRLGRAPRYRQRLLEVPFGLGEPVWADDVAFDITHHVRRGWTSDLGELADGVMSTPLDPARPLWELWIAERLDDGRLGVVGKAHHALVDGLAAVELIALLLGPIGMTSIAGTACFGVYADGTRAADADRLARAIGEAIDELVGLCVDAGLTTQPTRPIAMPLPRPPWRRGHSHAA